MAIARPDQNLLDALSAPIGDLIAEVGRGIAEAQQAMDAATIDQVRALAAAEDGDEALLWLRRFGWQPTWYQIPEASAEISVALTLTGSGESQVQSRPRLLAAPIDASYTNRYGFELKAASTVRFKVVPVPPSPTLEGLRIAPAVVGLDFAAARARLIEADVGWKLPEGVEEPADAAVVASQIPAPGEVLRGGAVLTIAP